MKIVCATDFSDNAAGGTSVAAALAGQFDDDLLLVHACLGGGQGAASPDVRTSVLASLQKKLEEEAAHLGQQGTAVEARLITGFPDQAILKLAVPTQTRLVVLAASGRPGSGRRRLRDVAERVAENASVPTLVVRQTEPFLDWGREHRPLKVLCAHDHSTPANAALGCLNELCRLKPCELVVAQVFSPYEEKRRLGISGCLPLDVNPPEIQAILERDLREKIANVLDNASTRIRVEPALGRPDARLIDIAEEEQADLIVTGTHPRHGWERFWNVSTSRALLRHAPMSVLVVPDRGTVRPRLPEIRRVLVATDFSEVSREAVRHACSLPSPDGTVRLVHVMHPRELPGGEYAQCILDGGMQASHTAHANACADKLRAFIPNGAQTRELSVEVEVVEHRNPAEGICQAAERFGADVVCLGTHGRSGWLSAALGSVTHAVMKRSLRPLLVLRSPAG
jgi:nucleotide-binding universal stress UspA family protein